MQIPRGFENATFLQSKQARVIRMMSEYEETLARLQKTNIKGTVLFFGSSRSSYRSEYDASLSKLKKEKASQDEIDALKRTEWMCTVCEEIQALAQGLTEWSITHRHVLALGFHPTRINGNDEENAKIDESCLNDHLVVSTGGGNGFMEAANRGAANVPQSKNMGLLITLPCEPELNVSVSPDLAFQFHYFCSRKFWLFYQCRVLICAPGGFGTLDELFEFLTMKVTGRFPRKVPIVLYGKAFWTSIVNWQALITYGVISQSDYDVLFFADTVQEAMKYITTYLVEMGIEMADEIQIAQGTKRTCEDA